MKNLITVAFMAGLATMAACSSDDSSSGTGGAAGAATGGAGGSGGSATGGTAGTASGGTAGTATGGMAGMAGAAGGTGDPCVTCLQTNCGTEIGGCLSDADCAKILQCAAACTDQACSDACITSNPNGKAKWDAVEACGTTKCATECT